MSCVFSAAINTDIDISKCSKTIEIHDNGWIYEIHFLEIWPCYKSIAEVENAKDCIGGIRKALKSYVAVIAWIRWLFNRSH